MTRILSIENEKFNQAQEIATYGAIGALAARSALGLSAQQGALLLGGAKLIEIAAQNVLSKIPVRIVQNNKSHFARVISLAGVVGVASLVTTASLTNIIGIALIGMATAALTNYSLNAIRTRYFSAENIHVKPAPLNEQNNLVPLDLPEAKAQTVREFIDSNLKSPLGNIISELNNMTSRKKLEKNEAEAVFYRLLMEMDHTQWTGENVVRFKSEKDGNTGFLSNYFHEEKALFVPTTASFNQWFAENENEIRKLNFTFNFPSFKNRGEKVEFTPLKDIRTIGMTPDFVCHNTETRMHARKLMLIAENDKTDSETRSKCYLQALYTLCAKTPAGAKAVAGAAGCKLTGLDLTNYMASFDEVKFYDQMEGYRSKFPQGDTRLRNLTSTLLVENTFGGGYVDSEYGNDHPGNTMREGKKVFHDGTDALVGGKGMLGKMLMVRRSELVYGEISFLCSGQKPVRIPPSLIPYSRASLIDPRSK